MCTDGVSAYRVQNKGQRWASKVHFLYDSLKKGTSYGMVSISVCQQLVKKVIGCCPMVKCTIVTELMSI